MKDANYWIRTLSLERHPEGGYYRETYRAAGEIPGAALAGRYAGPRAFCTAIYFLLAHPDVSAFHRIRSDEIWHFHAGSGLTIHIIGPGGTYRSLLLGADPDRGQAPQIVVPGGCWFGAEPLEPETYTLAGCTVSPGFEFSDFELARAADLARLFPEHANLIHRLCRHAAAV